MKATTTLGNLIEKVETLSAGNFDETVSLSEMEFSSLNEMWTGGVGVEVLPQAQRLLANRLGVPISYLNRCSPELQRSNLQYWLEQERKKRETFFCRFNGQKELRACFSDRYTAINNREILARMPELGFRPEQEVQYMLDDGMMVVKVPEYARSFEVALKDSVVPGLSIGNSEIGLLSFTIECFYLRVVCTNGMVVPVSAGQSRWKHISRKAFETLPETIRQVAESSNHQQAKMVVSVNTPVHNPIQTIESFNRRFGLTVAEGEMVRTSFAQEPGQTMWSVIQAYTGSARSPELTVEAAYRLERVGGQILAMVKQ
jgi:hypothetical protein